MGSLKVSYNRILIVNLPDRQSAFLWGARKTGKSTYLEKKFPHSLHIDLLKSELYLHYSKNPELLREEILALDKKVLKYPVIIDEVQKIPLLLNEIHWLVEHTDAKFILCGSSARKMKQAGVNMLGGRAWKYNFYPLTYHEIPDFDLLKALNHGLIPSHYLAHDIKRTLNAYIEDYLIQEIINEGLTRNLPAFAKFLDLAAFSNGKLLNFNNIARDVGIDAKTIKSYYEILVDTLIGYFIEPFTDKIKRETIVATPKFYLFDVGIVNALTKRVINSLHGPEAGNAFEHFILMELIAYRGINNYDFEIKFWRTKTGLEVDFILGEGDVAIEVKISESVHREDLRGLIAFQNEHHPKKAIVVSMDPRKRKITNPDGSEIIIFPYKLFLEMLWKDELGSLLK